MFEEIQTEATNTHKIIVNSVEMDLAKLKNVPQSVLNSRPHGGGDAFIRNTAEILLLIVAQNAH